MAKKPKEGDARPENMASTGVDVWRSWHERIDGHIRWLRDEYHNGWKTWRAAYFLARAKHWSEEVQESDELQYASDLVDNHVTFPFISTHIENMVGFLTQSQPRFVCKPRRAEDVGAARIQEALLNYAWAEHEFDDQHALALRDFVTIGHCVLSTGFAYAEDLDRQIAEGSATGSTNYDDHMVPGAPFVRRVNPFLFLKDRWASDGTLATSRWCAELYGRPLDDVLQDENFSRSVRKAIRDHDPKADPYTLRRWRQENDWLRQGGLSEDDGDGDIVMLAKVYDKRSRTFRVFALGVEEPLLEDAWPYEYLDGFPYVMRDFVKVSNEPYGMGFTHLAAQTQLLDNRIKSKMAEHAKKHNAKYLARGFGEDDDQLTIFENDEHGAILRGGPGASIEAVDRPQFGEDLFRIQAIVENDMRRLMFEDQLASGSNLPARTSAEEVRTRNRLFSAKLAEVIRSSEKLLRDTARQTLQHLKANPDMGKIVRIVGPRGVEFQALGQDDIRAEVDVDVTSVAREDTDPTTKRMQALDLMERMARMVPAAAQAQMVAAQMGVATAPLVVDFNRIVRYVLGTFDDRELELAFPEGPLPMGAPPPMAGPGGIAPGQSQDPTQSAQASSVPHFQGA
jgi:hypothetical protein